ncbi:MAG: TraB/GumN family protein [Bdellovibrionota bacterium]
MLQGQEIEPNVVLLEHGEKRVYVVGTAHVSRSSAELAERIIREVKPDAVCLELCAARLQSLENPDAWRETDLFQVVRSGRAYVLLAQLVLATFQKRIAAQFKIKPGEEMRTSITAAREIGAKIEVVDRDVKLTLKRAWANAGILGFAKIATSLLNSIISPESISEAEIEQMKQGDALSGLMNEFSAVLPGVKNALIDERDSYMSAKLGAVQGKTLVAVVGAGHLPGIRAKFGSPIDIASLELLPPKPIAAKAFVWFFPALLVGLMVYGFVHAGSKASLEMFGVWAITNMTFAAIGALVCLAHPLTILTAFLTAPFAAIHPVIAVGWLCALVEAFLRKPRVKDLETISDDLSTVRGVWTNRVSRVFLILILTNLGSVIGSVIGLSIAPYFLH